MPSTNDTGTEAVPQEQTIQEAAAPPPPPGPSMFADTPPTPPVVAEQAPSDPAPPSAPPAAAVEGPTSPPPATGDAMAATPPAAPVQDAAPAVDAVHAAEAAVAQQPASSATSTRVRLGRVEGTLHRVPLGIVQVLTESFGERIVTLQSSPSIADLQSRMRASEGRCAPIFFTITEGDDRPHLFSGVEALAAAINLSLPLVSVVTLDAGDAGAAQNYLASRANGTPASSQADVLELIE